jgi:hypothetical protein
MFDGKIFKPYSKKEKLGKLCEFTFVPAGGGAMAPSQANSLQQSKNTISQSNAGIIENEQDDGFAMVQTKVRAKGMQKYSQSGQGQMSVAQRARQENFKQQNQANKQNYGSGNMRFQIGQTKRQACYTKNMNAANLRMQGS